MIVEWLQQSLYHISRGVAEVWITTVNLETVYISIEVFTEFVELDPTLDSFFLYKHDRTRGKELHQCRCFLEVCNFFFESGKKLINTRAKFEEGIVSGSTSWNVVGIIIEMRKKSE